MLSTNGREVTILRMHQSTRMEGYGEIKSNLDVRNDKRDIGSLTARITDKGVLLTFTSKTSKKVTQLEIPDANIVSRELAPETNNTK